jgi:hypothetical protein
MSAFNRKLGSWVAGLAFFSLAARGQDAASRAREVQRLETELALAKSGAFYFVLKVESRTFELRARGLSLRSWAIGEIVQSGRRPAEGVYTISRKNASFVPTRTKIKPDKEDEEQPVKPAPATGAAGEYDLQALEVRDMPERFVLRLDSGLEIRCGPKREGVLSFFGRTARVLGLPLKTLFLAVKKKSFSTLELGFAGKKESQSVYWAAFEGQKIYIVKS